MSNEYKELVEKFIGEHITPDGYPSEGDMQIANELAARCRLRAKSAGLNPDAFEFNLGEPLEDYMQEAIISANDAEIDRQVVKDNS